MILRDAAGLKQDGGYAGVGPADVPRLIAYGLLLLAGLTVVAGLKGDLPRPPRQAPAPVLWIMGGLVGQLALLHVAGFVISGAILFGMTARGFGQKPLWRTCWWGFVLAFVIYGVFDRLSEAEPAGRADGTADLPGIGDGKLFAADAGPFVGAGPDDPVSMR
jgi:putative tricarboxylic transport membrane protein